MPLYRVSQKARFDIRQIGLYTEREWGRTQRRKYLNALDQAFGLLCENPRLAPEYHEFTPPVRIHHHEQHLVVYVIEDDGILIVRVLHESVEIDRHL
ncbi:MAG: type II toxin-antitoxin system RelE/ParE family toxin [Gammaproteobacteria bacterium]|nr:type II toxin-antitoxin system RelE/ParE family toxin [Gammaproteobacteria bacterium]